MMGNTKRSSSCPSFPPYHIKEIFKVIRQIKYKKMEMSMTEAMPKSARQKE